jgi:hypothetical protein
MPVTSRVSLPPVLPAHPDNAIARQLGSGAGQVAARTPAPWAGRVVTLRRVNQVNGIGSRKRPLAAAR